MFTTSNNRHRSRKSTTQKQQASKSSTKRRGPGRPPGSRNKSQEQREMEAQRKKSTKKGRPKGSRNKKGLKSRGPPGKLSYASMYMNATGGAEGGGTILELLSILDKVIRKTWTDEKILRYFGRDATENVEEIENKCHFYSSSKGRLISPGNNNLSSCILFQGISLSTEFLDHYIHSYDDVLTYGDYVMQTCRYLQNKAAELEN